MTTKTPAQELREIADELVVAGNLFRSKILHRDAEAVRAIADRIDLILASDNEQDWEDAIRFRAIADFEAVAINAHIVQVRRGDDFHTAYHKAPPSGVPKVLFDGDKLAALRAAVDSVMVSP